ncbi:hypothetical protein METBIDRAFT_77674 [Metschnikowia bicuspidata var. bicuspidata NRRL YB-4993]|uniref:Histone deacetylase domain-containing protein n=1 Tax=Metschnikowia bicuspidata var. bicuspidata NRRL YB-4993 TaxID=869754 RepID=A0A1A0HDQ8_9ASCO|nr:hypothetical protein METBIDRAFT_77674 [Metschnikowia bicuspidata var. bicuspidata NRRL YB-4993]OBA22219.1 hypothetical protein METBIDRAFT_77674 [Metschnikowia bicuspidata var. bicuspidata NRRL YB-4993]
MVGYTEKHLEDDSEESFISQFETTLTIRPTADYLEDQDQDLSIDHTTFIHATNHDFEESDDNVHVTTNCIRNLVPEKSKKISNGLAPSKSELHLGDTHHKANNSELSEILKPSPLIDLDLVRFRKAFHEFILANPQIKRESPRFELALQKTLVLLSPYSPEHAFGRKWVTKAYLSTIFERPQRLLASSLGIAAALSMYPYYYSVQNSTKRGSLFSDHVRKIHGESWPKTLFELCLKSHDKLKDGKYEVPEDWNTGDIYLTPKTITALEGVLGTIETAIDSLFQNADDEKNHNLAFVAIRPPGHHSHACLPSGFCMLNNAQIGIEYAFDTHGVTHCAILDIDLHHGDGSQDICWERAGFTGDHGKSDDEFDDHLENPRNDYGKKLANYPKVGYFSLHDIKSYPTELGFATKQNLKNASLCIMDHDLNLWNVHLQEWTTEEEFYKLYQTKYVAILNRANQFLNYSKKQYEQQYATYLSELTKYNKYLQKPTAYKQQVQKPKPPPQYKPLIIISAGFDASEYENPQMQRHSVNVPTSFYAKFTEDVVKLADIHTKGKVLSFLEGGYSDGALVSGIFSHLIGFTNFKRDNSTNESLWNETWGSEHVIKEIVRGCKKAWTPYKNPRTETTIWANEVIKLGRSMMPNSILPPDYMYESRSQKKTETDADHLEPTRRNKMLREIMDAELLQENLRRFSSEDEKNVEVRHTRSYYQRTMR